MLLQMLNSAGVPFIFFCRGLSRLDIFHALCYNVPFHAKKRTEIRKHALRAEPLIKESIFEIYFVKV